MPTSSLVMVFNASPPRVTAVGFRGEPKFGGADVERFRRRRILRRSHGGQLPQELAVGAGPRDSHRARVLALGQLWAEEVDGGDDPSQEAGSAFEQTDQGLSATAPALGRAQQQVGG